MQEAQEQAKGDAEEVSLFGKNDADTDAVAEVLHSVLTNQIDLQAAEVQEEASVSPSAVDETGTKGTVTMQAVFYQQAKPEEAIKAVSHTRQRRVRAC